MKMSRDMKSKLFGWLLMVSLILPVHTAQTEETAFHFMKIRQVFGGTAADPNAQYVMLQMYSPDQNFTGGHSLFVFDSAGTLINSFPLSDVLNGNNQAVILIATAEAETFFGITADAPMNPVITPRGGKVCFDATNVDCISWGKYIGSTAGVGTPFNQFCGGLQPGQAARRRLDICGSPTTLEFCDDANNSSTDFLLAVPAPRNNGNQNGIIPPATCGNGSIEGLEQCDDNNTDDGDGCSSSCQVEPPFCANEKGDLNGMGGLSPADAVLMLNCVFLDPTGCGLCYTDVNSDGGLTPSDAVAQLNAVFLGAPFPC